MFPTDCGELYGIRVIAMSNYSGRKVTGMLSYILMSRTCSCAHPLSAVQDRFILNLGIRQLFDLLSNLRRNVHVHNDVTIHITSRLQRCENGDTLIPVERILTELFEDNVYMVKETRNLIHLG